MAMDLTGPREFTRRPLGLALVAAPAVLSFLAALVYISLTDTDASFVALGICVVATIVLLAVTYRQRPYLAFVAPALVVYSLFVVFPAVAAFRYSLYEWSGLGEPTEWVGLGNYLEIFSNKQFLNALWNNAQLFLAIFIIQNLVGLPIALALDSKLRFRETYRAILFLPVIVSLVATGYIWQIIFGPNIGMLNPLLDVLNVPDLKRDWLADRFLTFKLIWLVQAWQHLGIPIVIYLAGLQAIPDDLKDAARIDGANGWQSFRYIVFPLLAPAFTVVTATTFIGMFRVFDIPFILGGPGGAPVGTTDVLSLVI
jgi:raffinose/stachyose/melibiose transport system permease protein